MYWDFLYISIIHKNPSKIFIYKLKTTRPVVGVFHNRNGKLRTEHTYRDFICGNIIIGKHIVTFFLISIPQLFVLLIQNIMLTFDSNESLHLRHEE